MATFNINGYTQPRTIAQATSDRLKNVMSKNINIYTTNERESDSSELSGIVDIMTTDKKGYVISLTRTKKNGSYEIRDGNGKLQSSSKVKPDGSKTETQYNYNGSQSIKIFNKTGTLIQEKTIPAPTQKPTPDNKIQAQSEKPMLTIDQALAPQQIMRAPIEDSHMSSIAAQASAKETLNPAMINAQKELQARQSQPHEQPAEAKGF